MKQEASEILSALMDGETTVNRAEHIKTIAGNAELRQTWYRYHLISDVMQGHLKSDVDYGLADRIRAALDNEPVMLAPVKSGYSRYAKPAAGLAIAASVAAAVLLGVQVSHKQSVPESTPAFASNAVPQVSGPVQFVSGNSRPVTTGTPMAVESPMNRYLVNYNEYRANSGVRGMLPYVRIVGHETPR